MRFFDLHCDTLYKATAEHKTLNESDFEVSVSRGKKFSKWLQCTAIWIPDGLTSVEQDSLFYSAYKKIIDESKDNDIKVIENNNVDTSHGLIFTVENGAILQNDINRVGLLKKFGVHMLTLTWNGLNSIGGGSDFPQTGLTEFGRLCVSELEKNIIIIDISHSSEMLFWDVMSIANKPLAASHSNSRKICNHPRNLTDDQFKAISDIGGVVGLNFHRYFLSEDPSCASTVDVLKNAEHFLSLGGENVICIGSDFDGSDIPYDLNSIDKMQNLYESFLKIGYNEQLVQKIMYDNAHNFFSRF